jgi:hypothetical protein
MLVKMGEARRRMLLKRFTNDGLILRTYDYHEGIDRPVIRSTQDVEPIIENNKRLYNDGDGYSPSREWKRAASVPNIIIEQWMKKGINAYKYEDTPKILAMLDSPEYRFLRTAPGRLSRRPIRHFFRASTPSGSKLIQAKGPLRLSAK